MHGFTDEQLVKTYLKTKDEKVLELLVQRYLTPIYGFVRHYTGHTDDASDITQETFVKVWKHLKSFDQSQKFKRWIFTIAKHTAIDWLKKKSAIPFSMLDDKDREDSFIETLADPAPSVMEQVSTAQAAHELTTTIGNLPTRYSRVIDLHLAHDLTFAQISKKLKQPLNTIKSQYRRGITLLKQKFN